MGEVRDRWVTHHAHAFRTVEKNVFHAAASASAAVAVAVAASVAVFAWVVENHFPC